MTEPRMQPTAPLAPPPPSLPLSGRVALVTGAAGGIGRATVTALATAGANVVGVDLPGVTPSGAALDLACDLADPRAVEALFVTLDAQLGRLDVVVHCAGIRRDAALWKLTDAEWASVLDVNLTSAFHLLRAATPRLRAAGGGAVVLVTSINGERGKRGQANYAASKAGLIGLGRTAARELGRFAIRVNLVAPGLIRTPMLDGLPPAVVQQSLDETVLGRLGEPSDVAAAILFLSSAASRHVTGQVLRVDGGQLIA